MTRLPEPGCHLVHVPLLCILVLVLLLVVPIREIDALATIPRRTFVSQAAATLALSTSFPPILPAAQAINININTDGDGDGPFRYSETWTGTTLSLMTLQQSAQLPKWDMARWPDPLLRRPAAPVDLTTTTNSNTDSNTNSNSNSNTNSITNTVQRACQLLQQTAQREGAVGLAAQQCGVDARMVYLEGHGVLVNPRIVRRSPETSMRVWQEQCLVLPPSVIATVLRDDWVEVQYYEYEYEYDHDPSRTPDEQGGKLKTMRLRGEASRCVQHELDHDRGILVLDHIGLEELENDTMRQIEASGHDSRMLLAYARQVEEPTVV
jgi:peptide deformylase